MHLNLTAAVIYFAAAVIYFPASLLIHFMLRVFSKGLDAELTCGIYINTPLI